jgi:hypothetical protein
MKSAAVERREKTGSKMTSEEIVGARSRVASFSINRISAAPHWIRGMLLLLFENGTT